MSSHYVYAIVNKINLKLYFGSHSWEGTGVDKNYYGSGTAIKRAVKKYGKDNFIVYPIKFYNTVEECRSAEQELLTKYNIANNPYCYNLKNGAIGWTSEDVKGKNNPMYGRTGEKHPNYGKRGKGTTNYGKHHTEETRKKISQAHKGKTVSEEHRKKLSQAKTGEKHPLYGKRGKDTPRYGKHHTEETRQKMSQAHKGENNPWYGKHLSEEHRLKIAQANKGRKFSEEHRQKLSQVQKGKTLSEEHRKNLLQSMNYKKIPVVAIQKDTGKIRIFESQNECARQLKLDKSSISKCLKGIRKQTGGYTFKYIEQLESGIYEGML